ncbi:hypothetical protein [Aquimarina pacifica]|uniref:hypothetical protein n=1 Tax=Aquimarina pacifica TaxID=1296415 RepID=UPI00046ECED0|nr:hypothetical protein [Aquimarina pacifica]
MKVNVFQIIFLILPFAIYATEKDSLGSKPTRKKETITTSISYQQSLKLSKLDKQFPIPNSIQTVKSPEFTFKNIAKEFPQNIESVNDSRNEAEAGFKEIDSTGRWISKFSNEDIQVLPVGIKHKINEVEYQLGFMKAEFTKDYTELVVFVKVILPQTKDDGLPVELFFGSNNVKLSNEGGIIGGGDLVLLGDMFIPFGGGNWLLLLKGGFDYETADIQNRSYVTIDCKGVKEMAIEGEVQFSRNVVLPLDEKTGEVDVNTTVPYDGAYKNTIQIPNRVRGEFSTVASSWNDLIVEISITPFVITGQEDLFTYAANNAVFDFSDIRTEGVTFPDIYYERGWLLNQETWRGVYVESLEIGLPKAFKKRKESGKRVSFEAAKLLLDSHGVSGFFTINNLIPINEGITSASNGWAYSVDKMSIELVANRLVGAGFEGELILPISDKTDQNANEKLGLGYKGLISEEEFMMSVATTDTLDFDVFRAKAQLLPDSAIELKVVDNTFRPKATLNGRMAISASQKASLQNEGTEGETNDNEIVEFKGITFQNLVLQTESPLITVDSFGYNDKVEFAGFPASIANIELRTSDVTIQLDFDLAINLMNESDKGFSANTRLGIKGKNDASASKQKWEYDGLDISAIEVEANVGLVSFEGNLTIRDNDEVYGDGFVGEVTATFGKVKKVKSLAIFGKQEFRYWYVDAASHGLNLPPIGNIKITGIAGGAFYRMTRTTSSREEFAPSGLSYIPDYNSRFGVKTMVFGAIANENVVSFGAGYEIEFNNNWGVNRLGLYGEAQIMKEFGFSNPLAKMKEKLNAMVDYEVIHQISDTKVGKTFLEKAQEEYPAKEKDKAAISGNMGMEFDFVNDSFHATLDAYVNATFIKGTGDKGRAGWGEIYVGDGDWFVYLGTPTNRMGIKMGIGPLFAQLDGYFMTGTKIPGSPAPPDAVAEILGVDASSLDYMRDENALGTGRGFAFGAGFNFDTGDIKFLMFYARLRAGIGFDLMMKNYGDATCSNTGDEVGINGWYTNGQAYAYLQGEIGIRVKLFFKKKNISIFKGGAAVLMQAKLPNPFWMRGYMSGDFEVLGGLVSGRFRFKVTIGEECEFENDSPLNGIKMITDVSPSEGDADVDVFTAPQATFSLKVNQPIIIPEDDGDHTYKVLLEKFTVTNEAEEEISGTLEWASNYDRVTFISDDILPPATPLKATVEVSFQEKINGVFQTIMDEGKKALETEERNFTTGTAPDYIPLNNIQYSYPVVDQEYFYPDEYNTGYIQLKQGQDYLFEDDQWQSNLKLVSFGGEIKETDLKYFTAENKLQYTLPDIDREEKYTVSITSFPKTTEDIRETSNTTTEEQNYDDGNIITITTNQAEDAISVSEIERLTYSFNTSSYRTFADKVSAIDVNEDNWGKISSEVIYLSSRIQNHEGFDILELIGNAYTDHEAMVAVASDLQDAYFTDDIDPILYQKYAQGTKYSIRRDPTIYGYRPKKALPILSNYITSLENRINIDWVATTFPYRYNLPKEYHSDYMDVRGRVINDYANGLLGSTAPELSIINTTYTFMPYGKYNVILQYTLPGGIQGSSAEYTFRNPLSISQ